MNLQTPIKMSSQLRIQPNAPQKIRRRQTIIQPLIEYNTIPVNRQLVYSPTMPPLQRQQAFNFQYIPNLELSDRNDEKTI